MCHETGTRSTSVSSIVHAFSLNEEEEEGDKTKENNCQPSAELLQRAVQTS